MGKNRGQHPHHAKLHSLARFFIFFCPSFLQAESFARRVLPRQSHFPVLPGWAQLWSKSFRCGLGLPGESLVGFGFCLHLSKLMPAFCIIFCTSNAAPSGAMLMLPYLCFIFLRDSGEVNAVSSKRTSI